MKAGRSPGTHTYYKVSGGNVFDFIAFILSSSNQDLVAWSTVWWRFPKPSGTTTPTYHLRGHHISIVRVQRRWCGRSTDGHIADKFLSTIFSILWIALLVYIAYTFIRYIMISREWGSSRRPYAGNRGTGPRPWGPGYGGGSGWFGGRDNRRRSPSPPPPYQKDGPSSARSQGQGGGPGFWTGVAAGGIGSYLYNRATQTRQQPQPATWDWERPGMTRTSGWFGRPQPQPSSAPRWGSTPRFDDDRGEGPSNLGSMRTSTGFGGSHVR